MTENTSTLPKTSRLNKKSVTFLGGIAVGVAVLGLVINDKLSGRQKKDEPTEA